MKFASKIVTLVIILNVLFTIAVLIVFAIVGSEPTILVGAWFGFTGGELWMLSSIKKTKIKNSSNIIEEVKKEEGTI